MLYKIVLRVRIILEPFSIEQARSPFYPPQASTETQGVYDGEVQSSLCFEILTNLQNPVTPRRKVSYPFYREKQDDYQIKKLVHGLTM